MGSLLPSARRSRASPLSSHALGVGLRSRVCCQRRNALCKFAFRRRSCVAAGLEETMSRGWSIVLAALLAWPCSASLVAAQSIETVSLGRFQPAAAPTNFIVTDRALSLGHLELSLAAYVDSAQDPFLGETDTGEV